MHTPSAVSVAALAVLSSCQAGPGFSTCPKATPCYDIRLEKCKAGDPTITNGAGLIYCDVRLTGFCDDKTVCYDFASGCVCEGSLPCHTFNGVCQAWTEQCSPKNTRLQWCPSSPPPVPTPSPPTTPPTTSITSSPSPAPRPTPTTTPTSAATTTPTSTPTTTSSPAPTNTTGTIKDSGRLATNAQTGTDSRTSDTLGIVLAIGGVVVVVAVIAAFVILRRRSPQSPPDTSSVFASYDNIAPPDGATLGQPNAATPFYLTAQKPSTQSRGDTHTTASTSMTATMSFSRQDGSDNSLDISELDVHRIAPQELALVKVEASGAYGEVLLAEYQGQSVAVKRLLPSKRSTRTEVAKFVDEIKLHAKMDSQYIVAFVGAAWSKPSDIMMVTEFMENGDLRGYLQRTNPQSFAWTHKLQSALDIAHGLVYLHMLDPTVIHRDLKSRNVLLNKAFQCKLTDFGVSREFEDMQTMTAGIGTYRWMAPEVLQDGHYAASADIFSFGVILAELDTHLLPYEGVVNGRGNPLTDTAIMAKVMNGELRPSFSATCPRWFSDLGAKCLSLDPSDRPTAMEIAYTIKVELRNGAS